MSGTMISTPNRLSSGKAIPASTRIMSSPYRIAVMFMPNSPNPPSGIISSLVLPTRPPNQNSLSGELYHLIVYSQIARDGCEFGDGQRLGSSLRVDADSVQYICGCCGIANQRFEIVGERFPALRKGSSHDLEKESLVADVGNRFFSNRKTNN